VDDMAEAVHSVNSNTQHTGQAADRRKSLDGKFNRVRERRASFDSQDGDVDDISVAVLSFSPTTFPKPNIQHTGQVADKRKSLDGKFNRVRERRASFGSQEDLDNLDNTALAGRPALTPPNSNHQAAGQAADKRKSLDSKMIRVRERRASFNSQDGDVDDMAEAVHSVNSNTQHTGQAADRRKSLDGKMIRVRERRASFNSQDGDVDDMAEAVHSATPINHRGSMDGEREQNNIHLSDKFKKHKIRRDSFTSQAHRSEMQQHHLNEIAMAMASVA